MDKTHILSNLAQPLRNKITEHAVDTSKCQNEIYDAKRSSCVDVRRHNQNKVPHLCSGLGGCFG